MGKIERKYLAHLINTTPSLTTALYFRLGKDLEEFNVELNPETEAKKNILGELSVSVSSYEPQSSVEPYYAEADTPLYTLLDDIVSNRKTLDDLKTDVLEVRLWDSHGTNVYRAYKESAVIEVTSYGGDTTGVQIPFNLHYLGDRVAGTYNTQTKTFTADSGTMGTLLAEVEAGTDETHTKITAVIGEGSGTLKYKTGASVVVPLYGDSDTGYTSLTLDTDIAVSAGDKIIVVETTASGVVAASAVMNVVVGE